MTITKLDGLSMWASWKPTAEQPWDVRRVVHLHRRAGFAATWTEIQRDLKEGPQAAVGRLLKDEARIDGVPADFARMADVIGDAAVGSNNPNRLKAWWLYRMLCTPDPLTEKLALLWHNHFATSNLKVDDLSMMRRQNEIFRRHARGPFAELLRAVVHDPAMLVWLDADSNRQGSPNENLAREMMELFTLGIGNYTEQDIKEAARALTGWSVRKSLYGLSAAKPGRMAMPIPNTSSTTPTFTTMAKRRSWATPASGEGVTSSASCSIIRRLRAGWPGGFATC